MMGLIRAELLRLYNRSKVYLYSSAPTASGWVEGFGFQPLEALVCGCAVFSNLHGGLADYLDPEVNAFKLETWSLAHDLERIEAVVREGFQPKGVEALARTYSEEAFHTLKTEVARAALRVLEGGRPRSPVNQPAARP